VREETEALKRELRGQVAAAFGAKGRGIANAWRSAVYPRSGVSLRPATPVLSPLSWAVEHRADVEVVADGSALLDALLVDIGAAVLADRTLGGAVEWAQPGAPDLEDAEFEGAASASAASVPVALFFTAAGSPLA
jgi:hypothetical protein